MSAKSAERERDTAKHNESPDGQTHTPKNICPEFTKTLVQTFSEKDQAACTHFRLCGPYGLVCPNYSTLCLGQGGAPDNSG